jgi:peptidoglycan/LPS O-acetylase OafA/YrhL
MANLTKYTIYVKRISKLILIVGLIIFAWWLQNYSAGYFWTLGNFFMAAPTSGAAIVAMLIAFFVLGLNVDPKDKSWNTGILGQIIWCFRKSGFYCYGIYVWHAVLSVFNDQILKIDPGFGLFCFLLLSIPIALISYSIVEKPFLKYKLAKTSM